MNYKLLIVEDDSDTAEMLRGYFEAQGYTILLAQTGHEALELCQTESPDLILLDVRLPDLDGFEVGNRLQHDLRTRQLPVIFVTERRERDYRITGLKLGAVDYITKPFDIQELRLRVRNVLHRTSSQNNPITGLAGKDLTDQRLALTLENQHWVILSILISGLSIFNEVYGFVARDDVLRAVALILSSAVDELGTVDDFVGQPAESQFVVITTLNKINSLKKPIEDRLNQAIVYFYPILDREAGYVLRGGPEGYKQTVPFIQLSTQVISCQDHMINTVNDLQQRLSYSS